MKQVTLTGKVRSLGKKSELKAMRRNEEIPSILYGPGIENVMFSVNVKELKAITNTPFSHIILLDVEGKKQLAILHEVQYHPVSDEPLHVDFLAISENKPVEIEIPIKIFGNSEGVKQGGKLQVSARKLRVSGLIANLPDELPIDITKLALGKQIVAGDLNFDGIKIISPKTTIICSVRMTRVVAVDETAPAADAADATSEAKAE